MYDRLGRLLNYYMLSGILLGAVLTAVLAIWRYEYSLAQALNSLGRVKVNSSRMVKATEEKEGLIREIKGFFPQDYGSAANEELLLAAVDRVVADIKGANITVSNMETRGDELVLPVNITASFDSYGKLMDRVGHLQGLTFPFFRIENIQIEPSEEMGGLTCKITGTLAMPVGMEAVSNG